MEKGTDKERILAVDDSPETLEMLKRNLELEGFEVLTAPGVGEAMRILDDTPVDLVITDYKMPKVSGMDLVRYIRENPRKWRSAAMGSRVAPGSGPVRSPVAKKA